MTEVLEQNLVEKDCVECGNKYMAHPENGIAFCPTCNYLASISDSNDIDCVECGNSLRDCICNIEDELNPDYYDYEEITY